MCLCALCLQGFLVWPLPSVALPQASTNQRVILKDPTPREPDLEKKLGLAPIPERQRADSASLAEYNRRRQELVARAAGQVLQLANTLHTAVAEHTSKASWNPELEVVAAIQTLALHIRVALTPPSSKAQVVRDGKAELAPASTGPSSPEFSSEENAAKLLKLAADLKEDAAHTGPDVVALRSIRDAEQIASLASRLQLQMQAQP